VLTTACSLNTLNLVTILPASTGIIRLSLTDTIAWRNNANSADLALAINGSDQLTFNGNAIYPGGITALTGDVTATGPGSVAASIGAGKVTNTMLAGSIAYSKLVLASSILNSDLSCSCFDCKRRNRTDNSDIRLQCFSSNDYERRSHRF
jgi:hypothetical protein